MNAIPHIIVQLVHMEGPLKGKIQEFAIPEILIGRHPDCQVQFPKDVVTLSRKHAKIVREGNRFKLIDISTNGTIVNGKQTPEAYLKTGDVITFSEGGPKAGFLTQVSDEPASEDLTPPMEKPPDIFDGQPVPMGDKPAQMPPVNLAAQQLRSAPGDALPTPPAPAKPPQREQPSPVITPPQPTPVPQSVNVPFAIQYGPMLKSFKSLPIIIGKGGDCDFTVDHPDLKDQQAQIFFSQDQYWIKDLTGTSAVHVNAVPISGTAALEPEMQVSLSPQGPKFRFLGGGRLVEVEDLSPQTPPPTPAPPKDENKPETTDKKSGALFKKFFSS